MNMAGEEEVSKSSLAQDEEYEQVTFYNHFWVFKKTGEELRLMAKANDIKDLVFEGSKFGAIVNSDISVTIEEVTGNDKCC